MGKSIYTQRAGAFIQLLQPSAETDCDGAWIIKPENRRYLSGFSAEDSQFTESSGSLLINGTNRLLITDSRYTLAAENEAVAFEVYTLKKNFVEDIPDFTKGFNLHNLGFEEDFVTWDLHRKTAEKLGLLSPPVALVPLNGVVENMREIKEDREVEALENAADMISDILDEVISALKPGVTEKDVAWQIKGLAREAGAEGLSFPSIVASGPNSALPHAVPSNRKIRSREPIILDAGVRLNGYCSDITRTVFVGEPDDTFKTIYRTVRQAQLAALEKIHPSAQSTQVDAVARNIIADAGFGAYFGHGLGHGVGLATHEGPRLGPRNAVLLRSGNIFTVEPGIYIPGKGGVRLEEMVVLEADGPRILTKNDHFYEFS
ncbi:MAG: aminopeptidase P family protein [Deltaproteobacteria bacterium]|nr:aminopeptidase P family protein [Deltaproteobacteria bacterium]